METNPQPPPAFRRLLFTLIALALLMIAGLFVTQLANGAGAMTIIQTAGKAALVGAVALFSLRWSNAKTG